MDLIGSKKRLNPWLFSKIAHRFPDGLDGRLFIDACCGSASTSRYAARLGCRVVATDLMAFPVALANGSICDDPAVIEEACHHLAQLRKLKSADGLFCQEYSPAAKAVPGGRPFFTEENAGLLDACRQYVDKVDDAKVRDMLLYCLVEAMSRVSNTMGTYGAFKKVGPKGDGWKPRALDQLTPRLERIVPGQVQAAQADVLEFFKSWTGEPADLVYIDPPYNGRQYGIYYGMYENLVLYDDPIVRGIGGLRDWRREARSSFCLQSEAMNFLLAVVAAAPARLVFVSYSSDGLLSRGGGFEPIASRLRQIPACRNVVVHTKAQRRYCADRKWQTTKSPLLEYLFEVEKKGLGLCGGGGRALSDELPMTVHLAAGQETKQAGVDTPALAELEVLSP